MTKTTVKTLLFATLATLLFFVNSSFADGRAGMSTLGYYKDPYSDEERSRRLYEEGLKHKAKAENRAERADTAKKTKEENRLRKKAMKEYIIDFCDHPSLLSPYNGTGLHLRR